MYDKDRAEARIAKLNKEIGQVKYWLDVMEPHLHKNKRIDTIENDNSLVPISPSTLSMQVRHL